jgi:hypothetical protein
MTAMTPQPRPRRNSFLFRFLPLAIAVVVWAALLGVAPASAHVDIDVGDGQYVVEIGFRDEPAFAGQMNAVYVHVEEYGTGGTQPVTGLASSLAVEVSKDNQTFSPALVPTDDGSYEARVVPTATGDYTFRLTGTIGDATVDESVTSGPTTFDSVQPLSAVEFPAADAATSPLQAAVDAAQSDAAMARTLGIAGIVVGVLGLIVAALALALARGKSSPAPAIAAVPVSDEPGKLIR